MSFDALATGIKKRPAAVVALLLGLLLCGVAYSKWRKRHAMDAGKAFYEDLAELRRGGTLGEEWISRVGESGPRLAGHLPELMSAHRGAGKEEQKDIETALRNAGLDELQNRLDSEDPETRIAAYYSLGLLGEEAQAILLEKSRAQSADSRALALWALGRGGFEDNRVTGAVRTGLADSDEEVRYEAVRSAGLLNTGDGATVTELVKLLSDPSIRIRIETLTSLGQLGEAGKPGIEKVAQKVRSDRPLERLAAVRALGSFGPVAGAVAGELLSALKNGAQDDEEFRREIVAALGQLGSSAEGLWAKALQDPDEDIRLTTAWALGEIVESARSALTALIGALSDESEQVRGFASTALANLGEEAIEPLQKTLPGSESDTAVVLIETLALIGDPAVPALIEALQSEHTKVQLAAVEALAAKEGAASGATAAFLELVENGSNEVRLSALAGLGKINPPLEMAGEPVLKLLEDPEAGIREKAIDAAVEIGVESDALPAFLALLDDPESTVRVKAIEAVGSFESEANQAVPVLAGLFDAGEEAEPPSPDDPVSQAAAAALVRIGPQSAESFIQLLSSEDSGWRALAVKSLSQLPADVEILLPKLLEALADEEEQVLRNALEGVREYGELAQQGEAKELVEALAKSTENEEISKLAEETLAAIEGSETEKE